MVGLVDWLRQARDRSEHTAAVDRATSRQRQEVLEGRAVYMAVGLAGGSVGTRSLGRGA